MAETIYRNKMKEKLKKTHSLEGENLDLNATTNSERGADNSLLGVKPSKGKQRGSKLDRELKRISFNEDCLLEHKRNGEKRGVDNLKSLLGRTD
jgi:hypothetical protein